MNWNPHVTSRSQVPNIGCRQLVRKYCGSVSDGSLAARHDLPERNNGISISGRHRIESTVGPYVGVVRETPPSGAANRLLLLGVYVRRRQLLSGWCSGWCYHALEGQVRHSWWGRFQAVHGVRFK